MRLAKVFGTFPRKSWSHAQIQVKVLEKHSTEEHFSQKQTLLGQGATPKEQTFSMKYILKVVVSSCSIILLLRL